MSVITETMQSFVRCVGYNLRDTTDRSHELLSVFDYTTTPEMDGKY